MIVVGNTDDFESKFQKKFPDSSAHTPDTLLGMKIQSYPDRITLHQPSLIEKGLELLNMKNTKTTKTPLSPAIQLSSATQDDQEEFKKLNINYRTFTGILNYLACRTRPDLAPAVSILSRFNHAPGLTHWKQMLHVWKYLRGTSELKLCLQPVNTDKPARLDFYTDATWADDHETRKSQSGSICFWKSCPISWSSKKQNNITMSSTESEMNALSDGSQENQWLCHLITELWQCKLAPTLFHVDNKGLLEKMKNFGSCSKTKHLDIKIKYLREELKNHNIDIKLIPTEEMIADALTKASNFNSLKSLQEKCFSALFSSNCGGC